MYKTYKERGVLLIMLTFEQQSKVVMASSKVGIRFIEEQAMQMASKGQISLGDVDMFKSIVRFTRESKDLAVGTYCDMDTLAREVFIELVRRGLITKGIKINL